MDGPNSDGDPRGRDAPGHNFHGRDPHHHDGPGHGHDDQDPRGHHDRDAFRRGTALSAVRSTAKAALKRRCDENDADLPSLRRLSNEEPNKTSLSKPRICLNCICIFEIIFI